MAGNDETHLSDLRGSLARHTAGLRHTDHSDPAICIGASLAELASGALPPTETREAFEDGVRALTDLLRQP